MVKAWAHEVGGHAAEDQKQIRTSSTWIQSTPVIADTLGEKI